LLPLRRIDEPGLIPMTQPAAITDNFPALDNGTRSLIQIAAAIAGAGEAKTRQVMEDAVAHVDPAQVDEVILQSYLFAGFPRTLNAARIWRSVSNVSAPNEDLEAELSSGSKWVERGEATCRTVYGESYELLRENIRDLHPALDAWMITDGYGKVLSRPGLNLLTRELCIVAACASAGQQRQLHSHLHGALNAGASVQQVEAALDSLAGLIDHEALAKYRSLLTHVASRRHPPKMEKDSSVR
jgi:4-carboxymuconolactone decarboxylase